LLSPRRIHIDYVDQPQTGINGQAQKLANPEKMASQSTVWSKVGKSPRLDAMA
jgi:hypothetical protein